MQNTRIQSLVQKLRSHMPLEMKPVHHNKRSHMPQLRLNTAKLKKKIIHAMASQWTKQ